MQHLVFGAGLIGCYLGAVLQQQGADVRLFCRPGVKQKLKQGIKLTDISGNQATLAKTRCQTEVIEAETVAVVWLTVKCTAVAEAQRQMAPFVGKDTLILCCQNGLGSADIVRRYYPNHCVLRVMVPFNVVESAPAHFHRASEGSLVIEQGGDVARSQQLASLLDCKLLPSTVSDQMEAILWAKLQLNLSNAVNALADIPLKEMLQQRDYRRVIAALMCELLDVVNSLGLRLPKLTAVPAKWLPALLCLPDAVFRLLANKMLAIDPEARLSMWWDLSQNKPTEIDFLNGAVIRRGQQLGIDCPANRAIVELIKQQHQSRRRYTALELLSAISQTPQPLDD